MKLTKLGKLPRIRLIIYALLAVVAIVVAYTAVRASTDNRPKAAECNGVLKMSSKKVCTTKTNKKGKSVTTCKPQKFYNCVEKPRVIQPANPNGGQGTGQLQLQVDN